MTLREQLARRLLKVGDIPMSMGPQKVRKKIRAERMADECIRQMEWARYEGFSRAIEAWRKFELTPCEERPMTLAPEDWSLTPTDSGSTTTP